MSRIAFVASPSANDTLSGGQAALDGDAVAERLAQADCGFEVVALDSTIDLAAQLDDRVGGLTRGPADEVLFFASARIEASEGELLLLSPADPTQGDALSALLDAVRDAASGPRLVVLEARTHEEPLVAANLAEAARAIARERGLELVFSVRRCSLVDESRAERPSPFTRALLESLDEVEARGLFAADVYQRARSAGTLVGASTYLAAEPVLAIVRPSDASETELASGPAVPSSRAREEDEAASKSSSPEPMAQAEASEEVVGSPSATMVSDEPASGGALDDPTAQRGPSPERQATLIGFPPTAQAAETSTPQRTVEAVEAARPPHDSKAEGAVDESSFEIDVEISAGPDDAARALSATSASEERAPAAAPASVSSTLPSTPEGLLIAAEALMDRHALDEALVALRKALGLVVGKGTDATVADATRASIHVRIAEIRARQGKTREAIAAFEKAMHLDPRVDDGGRVGLALFELYLADGDRKAATATGTRVAERLERSPETVVAWLRLARAWLGPLADAVRGRVALETAHTCDTKSDEVLRELHALAVQEGRARDASGYAVARAELIEEPETRAEALRGLGTQLLSDADREREGVRLLEAALEAAPAKLDPLVALSEHLADRQEWGELEAIYRRALPRLVRLPDERMRSAVEVDLHRRLALLLRDHLEDLPGAIASVSEAIEARPADLALRRLATELCREGARRDAERAHLEAIVAIDARDVDAHTTLFEALMRADELERAVDVASALVWMGTASDRVRVVYESAAIVAPARPTTSLSPNEWTTARAAVEPWRARENVESELVADVLRAASHAICGALTERAIQAGTLEALDESLRVDADASTVSVVRSLTWVSRWLGVSAPAIYLDEASPTAFASPVRKAVTIVVGSSGMRGRSVTELAFLSAHLLSYQVPEHRPVLLAASVEELGACFVTALRVVRPGLPIPSRLASLAAPLEAGIAARVDAATRTFLEVAASRFEAGGGRVDLTSYVEAVERAALRVGLAFCGRFDAAMSALPLLPDNLLTRGHRERVLLSSVASPILDRLRAGLGIERPS
jgi:tetratricopeptide (TPR) repeat protein